MGVFTFDQQVRFADCDTAGIMFYPRLFEMFQRTVEEWFATGLGMDYREYHMDRGWGMPLVRCECDFMAPSVLGDMVTFSLWLERLGTKSFTLRQAMSKNGKDRARARMIMVTVENDGQKAIPIPDILRPRMEEFLEPERMKGR